MSRKIFSATIIGLLAGYLFFGCSGNQKIVVNVDGSGEANLSVKLDPIVTQYILDLQENYGAAGAGTPKTLFDLEEAKKVFEKSSSVKVKSITAPTINDLNIVFTFINIEDVLKEGNSKIDEGTQKNIKKVVNMEIKKGVKTIKFNLNANNFNELASILPEEAQPLVAMFGPSPDSGIKVDEASYIEMVKEIFVEYDNTNIDKKLRDSKVTLEVEIKGTIISQKGGTVKGNKIYYSMRLLDLLILNKPLEYEISFK